MAGVKNLPANAGDKTLVPEDPMCCKAAKPAPQLLTLCARGWELQLLKPACSRACVSQQEKQLQ